MVISGSGYASVENDSRLRQQLTNFFNVAISENKAFRHYKTSRLLRIGIVK